MSHSSAHAATVETKLTSGVPPLLFAVRQHPLSGSYSPKLVVIAFWHVANGIAERRRKVTHTASSCSMATCFLGFRKEVRSVLGLVYAWWWSGEVAGYGAFGWWDFWG